MLITFTIGTTIETVFLCNFNFQVGLKSLLRQGISESEFYGNLYKLKKIVGSNNFSAQLIKIISNYKNITLMYCNRLHDWWSTQHGWQLCFPL